LDVKEREKREKGDQGKQSHRFGPQFYLQIVISIEHGIERGLAPKSVTFGNPGNAGKGIFPHSVNGGKLERRKLNE
jgi:hypothetical protein